MTWSALFQYSTTPFKLASGRESYFKIDCDKLDDEDIEFFGQLIWSWSEEKPFRWAIGVPTGGVRLANYLQRFHSKDATDVLLIDDVYTSGLSLSTLRNTFDVVKTPVRAWVMFARAPIQNEWVKACFYSHRSL